VFHHENEARHPNDRLSNAHKLNVIRAIGRQGGQVAYEIDLWCDDPIEAYAREAELIASLGRLHEGGPLTNRAVGGGSTAGPSPFSIARHSATLGGIPEDNPDRATLNRFVLSIAPMDSVVLKPLGQFRPRPTQRFPRVTRKLSLRQAAAVAASAAANGIRLDCDAIIPRRLSVNGVDGFIENGVSCDLLTSNSITLIAADDPAEERFVLDVRQARAIVGFVGQKRCADLGVA
jgi:hypothetical protein